MTEKSAEINAVAGSQRLVGYDDEQGKLDLKLPFTMRAGYKNSPARHRNTEPAFAIFTNNDHLLGVGRRSPLCGACGMKRAFSF